MYLTYDEYMDLGGTIEDETTFNDLEFQARCQVDWYTFNRLQNETELSENVKRCMFTLIKILLDKSLATSLPLEGGGSSTGGASIITNQSNDGVSVSYNVLSANDIVSNSKKEIESTVRRYLNGVRNSLGRKVLYRGLYPGE